MASLAWTDNNGSATDSATYPATINVGSGGAERTFFLPVMSRNAGAALASLTLGDGVTQVPATLISVDGSPEAVATDVGTNRIDVAVIRAQDLPDPTATTLEMLITWGASAGRCYWMVAKTSEPINLTPFDAKTAVQLPNGSTSPFVLDLSINVPPNGFTLVAAVGAANGAPTAALFTPSGVTANYNGGFATEAISFFGGGDNDMDAETARAISLTGQHTNGIFGLAAIALSFAPAGRATSKRLGGVPFVALPGRGNVW